MQAQGIPLVHRAARLTSPGRLPLTCRLLPLTCQATAVLKTLGLPDILELFNRCIAANAPERRRIYAYVYGTGATADRVAEAGTIGEEGTIKRVESLCSYRQAANRGEAFPSYPSLV